MAERGYKRRRYYVHEIQKEYTVLIVLVLLFYTFIQSLFLFGLPAIKLFSDASLSEKGEAAAQVLVFAEHLWPAVIFSLIASGFLGIYFTHKVAGPIYRFEQMLKRLISGDMSVRIKLREKDRLMEFSELLNQMTDKFDSVIKDVRAEATEINKIFEMISSELKTKGVEEILMHMEDMAKHHRNIENVLDKFRVSSSNAT